MTTPSFEVIAGTYEEFLLGYYFIAKQSELVQSIAAHDHSGSIRSIAVSGHYLATGSVDDRIIIYDLKSRKEHCMLAHHNATVNCLQFTNTHSHLISGSSDGVLAIVRVGNWQLEKIWEKAHKGTAILDIAIHPSGKLALTLGADCSLRTWNLVKGRQAYVINLYSKSKEAKSLEKIIWAKDGTRFILFGGKYTEVWSIESGGILKVIEHDEKVSSCIWLSNDEILVGYENGEIGLVNVNNRNKNVQKAHDGRVKALAEYNSWIVSGSSSGEIKVWNNELKEIAKQGSGCRITCLKIIPSKNIKKEDIEEVSEEVQKQVVKNVVKKSSVVVEVEGSDDEKIVNSTKVKRKHKDTNEIEDVAEQSETYPKGMYKKQRKTSNTLQKHEMAQTKKKKDETKKLRGYKPVNDDIILVEVDEAANNNVIEKKKKKFDRDSTIHIDKEKFKRKNKKKNNYTNFKNV